MSIASHLRNAMPVERTAVVLFEFDRVDKFVAEAREVVARMIERMSPAMRHSPPACDGGSVTSPVHVDRSPLADRLAVVANGLESLIGEVRSATDRIDI